MAKIIPFDKPAAKHAATPERKPAQHDSYQQWAAHLRSKPGFERAMIMLYSLVEVTKQGGDGRAALDCWIKYGALTLEESTQIIAILMLLSGTVPPPTGGLAA